MDWYLGVPGQTAMTEAMYYHSPRDAVQPPPGGRPITAVTFLFPADWHAFEQSHTQFVREWNKLTGMR